MSSAPPAGALTRANPPPPIELINGSVTPTAAAAATAASAAFPPARYVSAAASAAYGVPAAAATVALRTVVSMLAYYAPPLPRRAAQIRKMPTTNAIWPAQTSGTYSPKSLFAAAVDAALLPHGSDSRSPNTTRLVHLMRMRPRRVQFSPPSIMVSIPEGARGLFLTTVGPVWDTSDFSKLQPCVRRGARRHRHGPRRGFGARSRCRAFPRDATGRLPASGRRSRKTRVP